MKKFNFKKLASMGLVTGIAFGTMGCEAGAERPNEMQNTQMSEDELESHLNDEGRRVYDNLDADHKRLARQLAAQTCKGKNSCKGLNSCKSSTNSCEGQGGCKGTSPGPFKDKNDAVKVAEMAQKRESLSR